MNTQLFAYSIKQKRRWILTENQELTGNWKYSGDDETQLLWLDSSAESCQIFSKTTLETFRNKSPKLWSDDFTEFKSEIGFETGGDFLGFRGKFWEIRRFWLKCVKCWITQTLWVEY